MLGDEWDSLLNGARQVRLVQGDCVLPGGRVMTSSRTADPTHSAENDATRRVFFVRSGIVRFERKSSEPLRAAIAALPVEQQQAFVSQREDATDDVVVGYGASPPACRRR